MGDDHDAVATAPGKRKKSAVEPAERAPAFVGARGSVEPPAASAEAANPYAPPTATPKPKRRRRRRRGRREFTPATKTHRFINWIVDSIVCLSIWVGLSFLLSELTSEEIDPFVSRVVTYAIMFVYYVALEAAFATTLGKLFTNTVVINDDGEPPTLWEVVKRTLVRFVPFDGLSFLGERAYGWHDRWTGTSVIMRSPKRRER